MRSSGKHKFEFAKAAVAINFALGAITTVLFLAMLPRAGHPPSSCDFVSYWATGQQLAHHANPYDASALAPLEHAAGLSAASPCYMRNPPWGLPLALPLGFLSARAAVLPWSLLMLALLIIAVRIAWRTVNRPGTRLDLLAYAFPPALLCVVMGQTSILLLLGLTLFLWLHRTRPLLAGAGFWLCMLKPHLFLPFGLVLLLWIVVSRAYKILAGIAIAGTLNGLLALWLAPGAFREYLHWAASSGISHQPIPCLGVLLRERIDPSAAWIAFVPAAAACIWAVAWYWRRRERWDWVADGSLLMLVSIVAAPYCFVFDQCLAIPALLYGASRVTAHWPVTLLAALCIAMQAQPLLAPQVLAPGYRQLAAASAWLLWYLCARGFGGRGEENGAVAAACPA
jgi:hypothetical protein